MRIPFVVSLVGAAVLLAGCASSKPVEVGLIGSPGAYSDRMLDALGPQRYTEQQMIYMRKIDEYEHELQQLEDKRRALEQRLELNMLEAKDGSITVHDDEAVRMSEYANATYDTQSRLAQANAEREAQQALIENERDRKLLEAELEANRKLAALSVSGGLDETKLSEKQRIEDEAARERALLEEEADREILSVQKDFQTRISQTHQDELAARKATSSHKINLALTTAQAERRMRDEIAGIDAEILELAGTRDSQVQSLESKIGELKTEIKRLEAQAVTVREKYGALIAAETSKLKQRELEAQTLSEMSHSMLTEQTTADSPSQGVEFLERELESEIQRIQRSLEQQKKAIDERLSRQLSELGIASSGRATDSTALMLRENEIKAELASKKLRITNDARTEVATLNVQTEIAKAQVVSPVVTSRAVYASGYGETPKPLALNAVSSKDDRITRTEDLKRNESAPSRQVANAPAPAKPAPRAKAPATQAPKKQEVDPIVVVAAFEPQHNKKQRQNVTSSVVNASTVHGGNVQPLMVAPQATALSVIYRFNEKGSADKYARFLSAWGVSDFKQTYSAALDEHILLMGKFGDREQANDLAASLQKLTNTAPEIIERDL